MGGAEGEAHIPHDDYSTYTIQLRAMWDLWKYSPISRRPDRSLGAQLFGRCDFLSKVRERALSVSYSDYRRAMLAILDR